MEFYIYDGDATIAKKNRSRKVKQMSLKSLYLKRKLDAVHMFLSFHS